MNDDNKVYTPQIFPEAPFPQQSANSSTIMQGSANDTYTPQVIQEQSFPQPIIARETISQALDTNTKKILQEFEFTQSGAIKIGDFAPGVSGDVRISPAGILARNKSGDTTFALDGDTGDAIFEGTVTAGGFKVIDSNGLVSSDVFPTNFYVASNQIHNTSGFSAQDVEAAAKLVFEILRDTRVLITFFANVSMSWIDAIRAYNTKVWIEIDGVQIKQPAILRNTGIANSSSGITLGTCLSFSSIVTLGVGEHTMKMRWSAFSDDNVDMYERGMDYTVLGA